MDESVLDRVWDKDLVGWPCGRIGFLYLCRMSIVWETASGLMFLDTEWYDVD